MTAEPRHLLEVRGLCSGFDGVPVLRDVDVRNVTSRKSKYAFLLKGYERAPLSNIRVTDCTFAGVESADVLQGVKNLVLSNVRVNGRVRNETISKT